MKTRVYSLLGIPNKTIQDIKMTEQFCDEKRPDEVGCSLLVPFPCL